MVNGYGKEAPGYCRAVCCLVSKEYRLTVSMLVSKREALKERSSGIQHQETSIDTSVDNANLLCAFV